MHTQKAVISRLVLCQGSAQLLTAVSVLKRRDEENVECDVDVINHLVVFGLAVDDLRRDLFFEEITRIANKIYLFNSIKYITDNYFLELDFNNPKSSECNVSRSLSIDAVDEIYAARDWQSMNYFLLSIYSSAIKICYGDGLGYYFKNRRQSFLSKIKNIFDKKIIFDISYLMLDYDAIKSKTIYKTTSSYLNNIYNDLGVLVNNEILAKFFDNYKYKKIAILLTSNFSEQGLITLDKEISAYKDFFLQAQEDMYDAILIKSHPRDCSDKAMLLKSVLHNLCSNIIEADKIFSPYLPCEVFINRIKFDCSVTVFTFSSSFLPLKYICNVNFYYGFGKNIVKKYYFKKYVNLRLLEEKVFNKILMKN